MTTRSLRDSRLIAAVRDDRVHRPQRTRQEVVADQLGGDRRVHPVVVLGRQVDRHVLAADQPRGELGIGDQLGELVRLALGLDQRALGRGASRGDHAIAGRDHRVGRRIDRPRAVTQLTGEEVTERRILHQRELGLVEVRTDGTRERAIGGGADRTRGRVTARKKADQRGVRTSRVPTVA